ncbi:MAG: DNA replication/repair protein RecF [Colwellia sp.]
MSVVKVVTHNFRNLNHVPLMLHPVLNFFVGDNGSGKSSILEAIFYLGHGKSFRTSKTELLATFNKEQFTVSVKDNLDTQLGISKQVSSGTTTIRINGEGHNKLSELAKHIAVQIITPESFKLFFGGPKERRRFVDLGLFHVEHVFSEHWKNYSRVLKQRNACIKSGHNDSTLAYWTNQLVLQSSKLTEIRKSYVDTLREELNVWIALLLPHLKEDITVQFLQGWPQAKTLEDTFEQTIERELSYGFSLYGAHKFDVKFLVDKQALETKLSRGQQKLFLLALTFTQAKLIEKVNRVKPILLIDDIGAELDINSRTLLAKAINELNCQVLITAIEKSVLSQFFSNDEINSESKNKKFKVFHVEHGAISH